MNQQTTSFALDKTAPPPTSNEMMLTALVAESLNKHYPGHMWAVGISEEKSCVVVRDLLLSGEYGFYISIPSIYSASEVEKVAMRKAGELLERYKVARGKADFDAIDSLPVDFSGRNILLK